MTRLVVLAITLLFLAIRPSVASIDTVYLEISASTLKQLPIGVLPFEKGPGDWSKLDENPEVVLARDFDWGGRFTAVEIPRYDLVQLAKERASYYTHGKMEKRSDGKVGLVCMLSAAQSREQIMVQSYVVFTKDLRTALHDFSDRVTWQLWGSQGVASTQLAWVARVDGEKQIVVADYDGFRRRQITGQGGINTMPTWGKDNQSLFYIGFRSGTSQLFHKNLRNGSEKSLFTSLGQVFAPSASPVDDDIAFVRSHAGGTDIWLGNLAVGKAKRLTYHPAGETSPGFSPNGKEVLFSSDRAGGPQIHVMDRDGLNVRRITFMGKYNESATWSPNGDRIAYVSMDEGLLNIYTCDLSGRDVVQLTTGAGNNEHPTWSPDGMLIAFSSTRSGSSQIYLMRKDGSGLRQITKAGVNTSPAWSHLPKMEFEDLTKKEDLK